MDFSLLWVQTWTFSNPACVNSGVPPWFYSFYNLTFAPDAFYCVSLLFSWQYESWTCINLTAKKIRC